MAYWALKTRESGDKGKSFNDNAEKWRFFIRDGVIAIGWGGLGFSPATVSDERLRNALIQRYDYEIGQARIAASTIRKFQHLGEGDFVLICQGFTPNENRNRPICLYGTAINIQEFRYQRDSDWWRCQHGADIDPFCIDGEKTILKHRFEELLGQSSLMLTLQEISREGYESIIEWVRH